MVRRRILVMIVVSIVASAVALAQRSPDDRTTDDILRALVRLHYYGVFDFLAFRYEKGTVTLSGFAYRGSLKSDAVSAVKRAARVDEVVDQIELLPVSQNDERIRWETFYRIYADDFLSRYAPGGGLPIRFDRRFTMPRYPGLEPFGMYPIHIIVKRGRTLLLGAGSAWDLRRRERAARHEAVRRHLVLEICRP